jgi:hypothetical protein
MTKEKLQDLHAGFETAFINSTYASNLAYKPQFVSNNYKEGKKVLSSIEDELLACEQFQISVAFITMGGITPLLQTLQALEDKAAYRFLGLLEKGGLSATLRRQIGVDVGGACGQLRAGYLEKSENAAEKNEGEENRGN